MSLDHETLGPGLSIKPPNFHHQWITYPNTTPHEVIERTQDANIIVNNKVPITRDTIRQLPKLKLIAMIATGTNVVDLDACTDHGVVVSNIQNYATTAVPEHVLAAIFALRRNLFQYREEVIEGAWQAAGQFCYFNKPMHDLTGSTLGILGTGSIATALGRLANAAGLNVIYHSLSGRHDFDGNLVTLDQLLKQSDILSIHCPLTEKSHGLINGVRLQEMKSTAILINTARGEIVDLGDLEAALNSEEIAGAAIDVVPMEPPPADHVIMRLARRSNVLVTPHIAWASVEARQTLVDQLISNLAAFARGTPKNVVNTEVLT